eukprot:CAMPEP_0182443526 /NCGR_PEP_ID=MMETSP1172-20130603/2242_1 /TAXON_ID=708627 /ORGANISM="Timspurckia oligopyrenoides, Strain CCMP3278" /LENGTH=52 /DNA_ID=CAMNT_0024638841 /DNA_START=476 /DNA_END=634 /DNA_ORIENTATION=-
MKKKSLKKLGHNAVGHVGKSVLKRKVFEVTLHDATKMLVLVRLQSLLKRCVL